VEYSLQRETTSSGAIREFPSVNFKDETNINGDLRNESQKTQAERLKTQPQN
jgi:hypothetical protein